MAASIRVPTFEELDLQHEPNTDRTYLDGDECWIGLKWDIVRRGALWDVYRKGNYRMTFLNSEVARVAVADAVLWSGGIDQGGEQ